VSVKVSALFVILALALSAPASGQIPERAQWEITFARVETAAGLSDMRTAPPDGFEARLMERPWSSIGPLPFLRLVRTDDVLRAQLFVFWAHGSDVRDRRPDGPDVVCRDGICVKPIGLEEKPDWSELAAMLAAQNACPRSMTACGDCEAIWIKTTADGRHREQYCQDPRDGTAADRLLQLMKRSAKAAGY